MNKDKLFILSGPSGAGEDTIIAELKKTIDLERVITTTTRAMRVGESQGNPYYFISHEEFAKKIANDEFFEYAEEDNGNFYGVTKLEIDRARNSGKLTIWKIDYQGVITAKKLIPSIKAILIKAPFEMLAQRIKKRDNASNEFIQERLKHAQGWIENEAIFDFIVENLDGKLAIAVEQVTNILKND